MYNFLDGEPKPVVITKPDGSEQEFPSGASASRYIGITQKAISKMCRGMQDISQGYKARYKDQQPNQEKP